MTLYLTKEAVLVQNILSAQGIENPILSNNITRRIKIRRIASYILSIMNLLELDVNNDSLSNTPYRIAKMYVEEIFSGLDYLNFPEIMIIQNIVKMCETITVRDITITSFCEHHFIVFSGKATVAYIPKNNVIGLSAINKIVHFFSKRPQLQERLTQQIFFALQTLLNTHDVAVFIDAIHYCVKARGVYDISSTTSTIALGGLFQSNSNIREEFSKSITYCNKQNY